MKKMILYIILLIVMFSVSKFYINEPSTIGIIISFILICFGLYILLSGGTYLVDGATNVAIYFKIPAMVIGLTIVSMGTSAPELFLTIVSSIKGENDILLSNIVGSNICNLFLILGISALFMNLLVNKNTTFIEIPFSLFAAIILLILSNDSFFSINSQNILSRADGIILLIFFLFFLFYVYSLLNKGKTNNVEETNNISNNGYNSLIVPILLIIMGIIGLYIGSDIMVNNAVFIATSFGVSKILIGATIVGVGTSLPELVTSVISAMKKQVDIAVGNVIGSNIFNIFFIGGVGAIINNVAFNSNLNFDIIYLILATFLCFMFVYIGKIKSINKIEGIIFLVLYVLYVGILIYRG